LLLLVAADGYSVFVVVYAIFVRKGPQTNTFWLAIALIVAVTLGLLRVTIRVGRRVRATD
jgi:hypothetical protein